MRTLAIRAPAIILGGLGFSGGVSSIVRRTRRRRADARVLRVCLLQLVSVAETLTDLSYAERVITDITLKDARTFDVIGVQALH